MTRFPLDPCLLILAAFAVGCGDRPTAETTPKSVPEQPSPAESSGRTEPPADVSGDPADELWLPVSRGELDEGKVALFDGKTLFGWSAFPAYSPVPPGEAGWTVADGAIVAGEKATKLVPSVAYLGGFGDCDVTFEATPGTGSAGFGIFLPGSVGQGLSKTPGYSGAPEGKWFPWAVKVRGNTVETQVPIGQANVGGTGSFGPSDGPPPGRVGFGLVAGGPAKFRDVTLTPVGLQPLFNGTDLSGWSVVPGSNAKFAVEDETIHVTGGAGFLQTDAEYGDFVLQFEAKLNAKDVNGGLFFRAEPGTEAAPSNGYELQLQNTIAAGDRTKPADYGDGFGCGAIFRRQRARYVNASDGEWFAVTLVAVGNRFATWVNGLQVTDFTDDRPADANPRSGRRDAPGRISLQGHDGTTDASFRNLRIAPLPPVAPWPTVPTP